MNGVTTNLATSPGRHKSCYGYDDRSSATNSQHTFHYKAILDLYDMTCDKKIQHIERMSTTSIEDLEKNISDSASRNYSQVLSGSNPQLQCTISFESGSRKLRFDCKASAKSCLFYREFGSMRFLTTIINFSSKENVNDLFSEGQIDFAGLKYKFFGGEISDGKMAKRGNSSRITAWFFAEQDYLDATDLSVKELRNWIGDFGNQSALKVNSRFSLGFSPSAPYFSLLDSNVSVIDDIINLGGKLMTDGCGYISADLAKILPANARACGTSFSQAESGSGLGDTEGGSPNYLALIIQMRMVCHKGLFKGCLLVTDDENLCKPGCVVFRESMRKAQGAQRFQSDPAKRVQMDILSTFSSPQCRGAETIYSVLNRQIVILLVYRGLPKEFLIGLVEEEIKGMLIDIKNYDIGRRRAYKLVRQNMRRVYSDRLIGESLLNHNEDNLDDEDRYSFLDLTTAPVEIRRKTEAVSASSSISVLPIISGPGTNRACCIAEELQTFLHTGQKLDEPRVRQIITRLLLQGLGPIQEKCSIPLKDSVNLVGAYDPTDSIPEGAVFICINNGSRGGLVKLGTVLVCRSPSLHPGDLRKLEAVTTVEMVKFVENTRGGVIFFSTKGKRSSADMMSGGDFDGDIYKIIYNKEILKYITTPDHEPYTADSVPVPPVTPQKQSQPNVRVISRPPSFILPTPTRTEHETPSFYHSISTPSSVDSTASKLEFDYEGSDSIPPLSARGSMSEKTFVPGIATQPKNVYTRSSWVASGSSRNHANYAQSITPSKSADSSYTSPPRCRIKSVFHNPSQEADGSLKSVFDGLLQTAMAQSVGTFNNTCLLYQDNRGHGPASRGAIECAKMFSVAMDAHKSGASIPDRHNLIENAPKIPYYLDKRGEKVKSKEALVESLVLGHIYSKVEEYITKIIQEENENVEFVLDIDMRLDNYEDCLALWAGHVAECARRKREIMFGNGVADTLYLRNIGSGPNGKTFASSHERHLYKLRERELFDALIDEYRNHFEDSVTLHYSNNYSGILGINNEVKMVFMMLSRQYIASVVYTATYNHARNGNDEFKRSVSFCWDICGPELHAIKFKAMLRKNKQNSIDVILNTERNFM